MHACVRVCASYLSYLFSFLVLLQKTSMASEQSSKVFTCPVCLCSNHYPTTLQCLHYICIDCIKKEDAKHPGFVECPFCDMKVPVRHFYQKQQSELCEIIPCGQFEPDCYKQARSAKFRCLDCGRHLCQDCSIIHAKHHMKIQIGNSPALFEKSFCVDCKVDTPREVECFCRDHDSNCCRTCAEHIHSKCDLYDLANLTERIKSESLVDDLRNALKDSKNKIEITLAASKENVSRLEEKVDEIRKKLTDLRKKINKILDDFENDVTDKSRRIFEREKEKDNDFVRAGLRFSTAIEQSCFLFEEAINKAPNANFYDVFKKVESHNTKYALFVSKILEDRKFTELEFTINTNLTDIFENTNIGTPNETEKKSPIIPVRKKTIERSRVVKASISSDGRGPRYTDAAYLPNGNICLVDYNNKQCGLFDCSFQILDVVTLKSNPWTVTFVISEELAVTLPLQKKIKLYKVQDNKFKSSRSVSTTLPCWGVASVNKEHMAVAVDCKGTSPGVGIISFSGEEIFSIRAEDCEVNFGAPWQFDFDAIWSSFLISSQSRDSVICIDKTKKVRFEYKNERLKTPAGITLDADGNIYASGHKSNNIHQINPNG